MPSHLFCSWNKGDAIELIKRDSAEEDPNGQQTRKTFYLSDVFVNLKDQAYRTELERFFDLVFSDPLTTPTQHENAMFLAYASSLRSGQLGRQVGAAQSPPRPERPNLRSATKVMPKRNDFRVGEG
jgi:hypothetical protein